MRAKIADNGGRDKFYPYKMIATLLFEKDVPGVTKTETGMLLINYLEFRKAFSRGMQNPVPNYLLIIKEMGIFQECQIHQQYALVRFAPIVRGASI